MEKEVLPANGTGTTEYPHATTTTKRIRIQILHLLKKKKLKMNHRPTCKTQNCKTPGR
jgi:hypothetical protein